MTATTNPSIITTHRLTGPMCRAMMELATGPMAIGKLTYRSLAKRGLASRELGERVQLTAEGIRIAPLVRAEYEAEHGPYLTQAQGVEQARTDRNWDERAKEKELEAALERACQAVMAKVLAEKAIVVANEPWDYDGILAANAAYRKADGEISAAGAELLRLRGGL